MRGNRPLIEVAINGEKAKALVNTGAVGSVVWRSEAVRLHLPLVDFSNMKMYGVGGETRVQLATIHQFTLQGATVTNLRLPAAGEHPASADGGSVILGEDFWSHYTVEFDLGHGMLRLYRTDGCKDEPLAYWSNTYSVAALEKRVDISNRIEAQVSLNGVEVTALLDTGAWHSAVTNAAAAKAGITPKDEGVRAAGSLHGFGAGAREAWVGTFPSFAIGDERIQNAQLYIADLFRGAAREELGSRIAVKMFDADMLLGADFFQSHRVMVVPDRRRIEFTYNGGPVFRTPPPGEPADGAIDRLPQEAQPNPAADGAPAPH
jgi:predicted aspartyl protease